ncbi:MAG TPA: TauD/TfdA family dioxygenase [Caulobacteraceae bacterium]|nr:TauD/TfdA family dioxygenase [Caulobacteraceae bacterium]
MRTELEIGPLSEAVGAEVAGIDLAAPLAPPTLAALRQAWLDAGVLVFRDQTLDADQFMAVARAFGEPMEYPFLTGLAGHPMITEVIKLEHETVNFGGVWHSDTTYLPAPPMATLLLARETPAVGGDTLFASQVAADDALPTSMQARLSGLRAVNSSAKAEVARTREDRLRDHARPDASDVYEAVHPVVREHPETGLLSLFVNPAHTVRFEGMDEAESAPLLAELFEHQVRPEFTCRVRWSPGTLAIWDNRSVLHFPINDYDGHRRVMHRITLKGDVPV